MHLKLYRNCLQNDFAVFGFVDCPLTDAEIEVLYRAGIGLQAAYTVGVDVSAGYEFKYALEYALTKQMRSVLAEL